jgi:hypothetical protein
MVMDFNFCVVIALVLLGILFKEIVNWFKGFENVVLFLLNMPHRGWKEVGTW